MVTRPYHSDEEYPLRRYSSRGNSTWHISHDRFASSDSVNRRPSTRDFQLPSQDHRNGEHDSDGETTNQQPRRRIAVACGRCRKRKIRCSGDPGNGSGCSNCKQAGNTQCQFLRVASEDCHYLPSGDSLTTFQAHNARSVQCVVPSVSFYRQPNTPYPQVPAIDSAYRSNSISGYQYPSKQLFNNIPWSSEYSDEPVDYNSSSPPYPLLNQDHLNIPNYTHSSNRGWSAPHKESSSIFVDQDTSSYTHTPVSYNHNMVYRPPVNADTSFSLSQMASSLPNASPIPDRMLPKPATGRTSLSYSRPDYNDGPLRTPSNSINMTGAMAPPASNGVLGSHCGPYLPLSSSPDSNPSTSSQLSYSHVVPSSSADLYPDSLYGSDSLRHQESSDYMYSSEASRKDSLGRSGQAYGRGAGDAAQAYPSRRASLSLPAQNVGTPLRAN